MTREDELLEALERANDLNRWLLSSVLGARSALERAKDDMAGWGAYASDYFQEKWGLKEDLDAIDAALVALEYSENQ